MEDRGREKRVGGEERGREERDAGKRGRKGE